MLQRGHSLPTPRAAPRAAWGAPAENQPAGVDASRFGFRSSFEPEFWEDVEDILPPCLAPQTDPFASGPKNPMPCRSQAESDRHRFLAQNAEEVLPLPELPRRNAPSGRDPYYATIFSVKLVGKKPSPKKKDFDSDIHSTFSCLVPEVPRGALSSRLLHEGVMKGERPEAPEETMRSTPSQLLGGAVASAFNVLRPVSRGRRNWIRESRSGSLPRRVPAVAWGEPGGGSLDPGPGGASRGTSYL
mmetsp:Transcript_15044/g.52819  ORF Transcript_15044/g.52819 Transcript_15044/m.52819 type:complete len:244 (+) Transcript_15044:66-797(+)